MLSDTFCVLTHIVRFSEETVGWTLDAEATAVENMGLDHRGPDIAVAEEFLGRCFRRKRYEKLADREALEVFPYWHFIATPLSRP